MSLRVATGHAGLAPARNVAMSSALAYHRALALPMSVWFCRRRFRVASVSGSPATALTMYNRVHATWSSHSTRIESFTATWASGALGALKGSGNWVTIPAESVSAMSTMWVTMWSYSLTLLV